MLHKADISKFQRFQLSVLSIVSLQLDIRVQKSLFKFFFYHFVESPFALLFCIKKKLRATFIYRYHNFFVVTEARMSVPPENLSKKTTFKRRRKKTIKVPFFVVKLCSKQLQRLRSCKFHAGKLKTRTLIYAGLLAGNFINCRETQSLCNICFSAFFIFSLVCTIHNSAQHDIFYII